MLHFNFRKLLILWLICLLFWGVLTFGLALQMAHSNAMSWTYSIVHVGGFWISWAVVAPLFLMLARNLPLAVETWKKSVLAHLALSFLALTFSYEAHYLTKKEYNPDVFRDGKTGESMEQRRQVLFLLHNLIVLIALISGAHAVHFYQLAQDERSLGSDLKSQLAEARLQVLLGQLQPHFLFNALNSIAALIHEDIEKADAMLVTLSSYLRTTIDLPNVNELPLNKELEFTQHYLTLEKIRFEERVTVDFQIAPDTLDAAVPTMLLQPLLENAFRHGFANLNGPGLLRIETIQSKNFLHIVIENDGPKVPVSTVEGTGLLNTRARLKSLYGDEAKLGFKAGAKYVVNLKIPLRLI